MLNGEMFYKIDFKQMRSKFYTHAIPSLQHLLPPAPPIACKTLADASPPEVMLGVQKNGSPLHKKVAAGPGAA